MGSTAKRAADSLKPFSILPQRPKQVLFPPVARTHHSCGSEDSGVTLPRMVSCQVSRVRWWIFASPTLAVAASRGDSEAGEGI